MDEEFESFVVTNPELVDPGIDVSGLRTTTDANILGNITDFPGIQYEAYNPTRLSDLMNLYSRGLPTLATDTAQIPGAVDTLVDVGGGGGGGSLLDTPTNTNFEQGLIDQGVGVQGAIGDPVVAPGEMPVTQEEMDAFNQIPVTQPMTGGITGDPIDVGIPDSETNFVDSLGTIAGAPVVGNFSEPTTIQGDLSQVQVPGVTQEDLTQAEIDAERLAGYTPSFETPEQQQSFFQNVLGRAGQTVEGALTELGKVPGAVVDFANKTVDVFGQKLNVGKTLAAAAINKVVGAPISLVFDLIGTLGLEGGRGDVSDSLAEKYGRDDIGRLTTGVMAGYSVGPNFTETVQERIDNIKNRKAPQTDASRKTIEELETIKAEAIAAGSGGVVTEPGTVVGPGEMPVTQEEIDAFNAPPPGINLVDEVSLTGGDNTPSGPPEGPGITADDAFANDGPSNAGGPPSGPGASGSDAGFDNAQAAADAQAAANQDAARGGGGTSNTASRGDPATEANRDAARGGGGGGSSGGGGKIVCTMMNESYGFGSFRNKIWLKHSKDLAPEYQKGYHKIFLPLVKLSKNNKVLKTMLEHIAVHRTIDIRQESRGKMHLLGRVYRKILEPICYWVGKYAK